MTTRCIRAALRGTLVLCLAATGCAAGDARLRGDLSAILDEQAAAWNRGDLGAFMRHYWHSPELSFSSGGRTEEGWEATLARYQRRYPTPERMGRLAFQVQRVQSLCPSAALLLGDWRLERRAVAPSAGRQELPAPPPSAARPAGAAVTLPAAETEVLEGNFTLVFQRFAEGWKIIHDHPSLLPREESAAAGSVADENHGRDGVITGMRDGRQHALGP